MFDPDGCTAYQSYIINSDGSFTYNGDTQLPQNLFGADLESVAFGLPSILGNETFAYAEYANDSATGDKLVGFRRASSGALQAMQFSETDPTPNPDVQDPDASPTRNYVVAQLTPSGSSSVYLASYTVDAQGNLSTTNTTSNMPITTLRPDFYTTSVDAERSNSTFSPSGNLFVLYGGAGTATSGTQYNGIEIYHFNGANPLTLYTKLLTGTPIDDVAWDSSNHLYAISEAENKLYVFTVTSTSVTQDSTVSIGSPYKLVVASPTASSSACSAPSTNGVNVCSPAENATVTSPVPINAAATVSGGVYRFELWSGGTKLLSEDSGVMVQSVTLAPGNYHLVFSARNTAGLHEAATRDITVK